MQMNEFTYPSFQTVLHSIAIPPAPRRATAYDATEWSYDDLYVINITTMELVGKHSPTHGDVRVPPNHAVVRGSLAPWFVNRMRTS